MKVSDIISGKISLEPLNRDKKGRIQGTADRQQGQSGGGQDSLSLQKSITADMVKIRDLQNSFFKGNASLDGFQEIRSIIREFEQQPEERKDWSRLSQDIKAAVSRTMFNGESVISYLSTNIKDEKSLYTLKTTLDTEIQGAEARVHQARKQIGRFLVQEANREAAARFSPERVLDQIRQDLNPATADKLVKGLNNIQRLLQNES